MPAWKPDEKRFTELLLYISERFATNPKFGAVKLNKLLFYCDVLAYAMLGRPLTGFEYQKRQRGPVPRRMLTIRDEMAGRGDIVLQEVPLAGGKTQHRVVPQRHAQMSGFSTEEMAIVDNVLAVLKDHDAEAVSELSHIEVGWKAAAEFETIPYGTAFLSNSPLGDQDLKAVQRFAKEHGYIAQ